MPIDISKFTKSFVEPHCLPDNSEAKVRIETAEETIAKTSGNPMIAVRLSIPADPAANDIFHNQMLPGDGFDAKQNNNIIKRLGDFCTAFGIPNPVKTPKFSVEDWIGKEGYWILKLEETDRGPRNSLKQPTKRA